MRNGQQASQRAAVAEARAQAAAAETARVRENAARELEQLLTSAAAELGRLRADTTRERDELRELLEDRARTLTEARDTQRRRAPNAPRPTSTPHAPNWPSYAPRPEPQTPLPRPDGAGLASPRKSEPEASSGNAGRVS